jgi:hypothetical protein
MFNDRLTFLNRHAASVLRRRVHPTLKWWHRIRDAWNVLTGRAWAVEYDPQWYGCGDDVAEWMERTQ